MTCKAYGDNFLVWEELGRFPGHLWPLTSLPRFLKSGSVWLPCSSSGTSCGPLTGWHLPGITSASSFPSSSPHFLCVTNQASSEGEAT